MTQQIQGFYLDQDGLLTVNISNPFGLNDESIVIGDEDHTEAVLLSQLSNSTQEEIIL